jgi:spore coat polysaccharide biosynthesis protein SpsF
VRIGALIQARMSSSRFPGKVLAPLAGQPLVLHTVARVREALPADCVVVVTSTAASDDPLAAYLDAKTIPCIRGSLDDVFGRMLHALDRTRFDWFFRISADSPFVLPGLMREMIKRAAPDVDLVTNVLRRTFPKGHSLELIRTDRFRDIDRAQLTADDREHVTPYFYRHADKFNIVSFENLDAVPQHYVIDTMDDLVRLQHWVATATVPTTARFTVLESKASAGR